MKLHMFNPGFARLVLKAEEAYECFPPAKLRCPGDAWDESCCHGVVMSKRQFVVWRLEAIDEVSEDYEHCQRVLTFRLLGFHRDRSKLFRTWLRSWCPGDD